MSNSYPEIFPTYVLLPIGLPIFAYLFYRTAKEVRKPLDESIKLLEKLSKGDLNISIYKEFINRNDELGKLTRGIQGLSNKLKLVIEGISDSATEIDSTGEQLSSSSLQLSQSANEQASSLEEVSATMEEIVSSIQQNAENSEQTKNIVISTSESMEEGTQSTNIALDSLKEIADKITIINDIAFQTNLLALNATVEADRAVAGSKLSKFLMFYLYF